MTGSCEPTSADSTPYDPHRPRCRRPAGAGVVEDPKLKRDIIIAVGFYVALIVILAVVGYLSYEFHWK